MAAVIILVRRKKIHGFFKSQREQLEHSMKFAAEGLEKIEAEYKEIKSKVDQLEQNIIEVKNAAEEDLERELQKIKKDTEQFVEKIQTDFELRMSQASHKAKKLIETELVEIGMAKAKLKLESLMKTQNKEWTNQMLQSELSQSSGNKTYAS